MIGGKTSFGLLSRLVLTLTRRSSTRVGVANYKHLRNGPCGCVRPGGYCEVYPERRCVWTQAWERSRKIMVYGKHVLGVQPPVNWQLEGTSAWINMLTGADQPPWGESRTE